MTARDTAPTFEVTQNDLDAVWHYGERHGEHKAEKSWLGGFITGAFAGAAIPTVVLSLMRAEEVARVLVRWGCL